MKKKTKLDDDYRNFSSEIERQAEEKIKAIEDETVALKEAAHKIGEAIESSIKSKEEKPTKKKVNSQASNV
jgi:hypothetical protein